MKANTLRHGAAFALAFLFAATAWAHSPRMLVDDLGDGTIYIDVGFSDGSSGAGHRVVIKEKETGRVLSEHRVPAESAVEIPMPTVPYIVVFDAGPGHETEQDGPFTPRADAGQDTAAPTSPAATSATATRDAPPVTRDQPATPPVGMDTPAPTQPAATPPASMAEAASIAPGTPMSPGAEMAWKMMLMTQVVSTVLLALIFGALLFWIGYSVGKNHGRR